MFVPKAPIENHNVTKESLFYHFLLPASVMVFGIVGIVTLLAFTAQYLVKHISIERELSLFSYFSSKVKLSKNEVPSPIVVELSLLVKSLSSADPAFPYEPWVHVYCNKDPNAFAFVAGMIAINSGLLKTLKSENGLVFVLAHELGHLKNRHHLQAMSRGLLLAAVGSIFSFDRAAASLTS